MTVNAIIMMIIILGAFFGGFAIMLARLLRNSKNMDLNEEE